MRFKYLLPVVLSLIVVGCGKSEEDKKADKAKEQLAMQIEKMQMLAATEAFSLISGQKGLLAEFYVENGECFNSSENKQPKNFAFDITSIGGKYVEKVEITKDCEIKATFKDNAFTPDLTGEILSLKMTATPTSFDWSCHFTGKNQRGIPKVCKNKP